MTKTTVAARATSIVANHKGLRRRLNSFLTLVIAFLPPFRAWGIDGGAPYSHARGRDTAVFHRPASPRVKCPFIGARQGRFLKPCVGELRAGRRSPASMCSPPSIGFRQTP